MKKLIKKTVLVLFTISLLSGCVNDTFEAPITEECVDPGLVKNKEVTDIYAVASGTTATYTANDIIEAVVVSSDEGGNFYKSMYLQPLDGSKGFNLSVDDVNLYTKKLQPGKKVFVKLKGLSFANPTSFARGLIIGASPTDVYAVDRIPTISYKSFIVPACDVFDEDDIIHHITLAQATANDTYLNTLVEIDDVQFETEGGTYDSNTTDDFDSSIYITNGTNSLAVRTSRFANFAGYVTPSGRGKIRGVLTKYGTGSNPYQLVLRTERDTEKMTGTRTDYSLPIVGNAIQYLGSFTENFESYSTSSPANRTFPKYINDPVLGSRFWANTIFSGNKYIQMTSFGGAAENNRTLFFVPVDMTAASTFSFQSKAGFHNGNVLKVYYILASNYTPGGVVNNASLVDITSNFTISPGLTSGYPTSFTNSGNYSIPASITGNGYFVFEYVGSGISGLTTTMQIDNIVVN